MPLPNFLGFGPDFDYVLYTDRFRLKAAVAPPVATYLMTEDFKYIITEDSNFLIAQ